MNLESLVKLICANDGSMAYKTIEDRASYSRFFGDVDSVIEGNDLFTTVFMNGEKTVIATTKIKLCRAKDCQGCTNLHLCKFFLLGDCPYGRGRRGCCFSHDLESEQNAMVREMHGLSQLDKRELCILLLQSDYSFLPAVCRNYNNGAGLYGQCHDGDTCKRLHICERYLQGTCQCSRAHDFYEPHPMKTLQDRGIPNELMPVMKTVYSNIQALQKVSKVKTTWHNGEANAKRYSGQRASKEGKQKTGADAGANNKSFKPSPYTGEKTEICMYFVKGHCKHGEKCFKEHTKVPYKWELNGGHGWEALLDNESIEKDYCDPDKSYSSKICFDTMSYGITTVRRLSTVSSVTQPTFILTTNWAWYWQDEYGSWIQYASSAANHNTASITSQDLEQSFIQDPKSEIEFTAGSQSYTISFQDMLQTNKRYGTKKIVRRRPVFVSAADAQTIRTSKPTPNIQMKSLPSHWNKALVPEIGYKKILLQSDSTEYKQVQTIFNNTMRGFTIQQIERVQNKTLWEVFQWQRDRMMKNNAGRNVTEKQLFHGTDSKHIEAICRDNFDWRICGTHGTAYGKGSYFARDADYSHNYTGDAATRSMFICRILVGDYTRGDSSYVRPPSKDGGDTYFYDSCVNDVSNPSIFVVFEKHQIYPEYLIYYGDSSSFPSSNPKPRPLFASLKPASPAYAQPASPAYAQTARPAYAQTARPAYAQPTRPAYAQPAQTPTAVYRSTPATVTYSTPSYSYNPPQPQPSKTDSSCIIS